MRHESRDTIRACHRKLLESDGLRDGIFFYPTCRLDVDIVHQKQNRYCEKAHSIGVKYVAPCLKNGVGLR